MAFEEMEDLAMRLSTRNQLSGTITEVELGTVMAVDEESAIAKAIEEFKITNPIHQKRLVAQRRE